jgi:putative ABC transport system permease protein
MIATLFSLACKSLTNRLLTVGLTVFAISFSVFLLLGVEKIRTEAKGSFANTISGTDLIVGARSGSVQLLLYSVFRIGNATNNVSWKSYQAISNSKEVAWTIPLSLGDSHRGFRVLGTTNAYFKHYRYGSKKHLRFETGKPFEDVFHAVLGHEVAERLGYKLNDKIVLSHGIGIIAGNDHADKPFRISGVLAKTGTPLDRTIHVSLKGMEAIHIDWRSGAPIPGMSVSAKEVRQIELQPKAITAFLVGLKSKLSIFKIQRLVNQFRGEPLLAILPGVALQELWDLMSMAEAALGLISVFVVVVSLLVMLTMLFSSLNERRREMAILRSVGARLSHIFFLLVFEAGLIVFFGILAGLFFLYSALYFAQPIIEAEFGLFLAIHTLSTHEIFILAILFFSGLALGAIPAYRAYRQSLSDGMNIHL